MSLSAAKSRVMQAKEYLASNRLDQVEPTIAAGEKFLADLPANEADPVRAEFNTIRNELAQRPTSDESRQLSGAEGKIRQARAQLGDRQLASVEATLAAALKFLENVREEHRAKLASEVEKVRAELGAALEKERAPAASPAAPVPQPPAVTQAPAAAAARPAPVPTAAPATSAPLTDDDHAHLSRARGKVNAARMLVEAGRAENVEATLAEATALLDRVPANATTALRTQIAELLGAASSAADADTARRIDSELARHLSTADSSMTTLRFDVSGEALGFVTRRVSDPDVKKALSSEQRARYLARVDELRKKLSATVKAQALGGAQPLIEELEQRTEGDPFTGRDEQEVHRIWGELGYLRARILGALALAPEADPDLAAIVARVNAVDRKVDAASAAWGKAALDASVSNSWSAIQSELQGWDSEAVSDDPASLIEPALPLTRRAVQRTRALLESPETVRLRREHDADPAVQGTLEEAERVFARAAEKLQRAYLRVIDAAEKLETPMSQFVLSRPSQLAYGAEHALEGTPYRDAVVTRARALDDRWKAEVAAILKARQALYDKLAAEADLAWPGLRDAIGAQPLDPATARPGLVVRLDQVFNRAGWDFGSREYSFAARVNGVVLGGVYAPRVLQALEHAWYELKLSVNDRIPWDVLAVIEAPAKIGLRTRVSLRDADTNLEIGSLEEWPPIDCLRIRIIGLHAGPVAVAGLDP